MQIPLRLIESFRHFGFLVPLLIATTSLSAIDVRPTDLYTLRFRIDSPTWEQEPLMISTPTAVLVAGEDSIIRSGAGQAGQLWRFTPATGKSSLLGDGSDFRAFFGSTEIAGIFNEEVYIMTGTTSASTIRTMAVNLETLETRSFQIASQNVLNANLVLASNGNLITMAATGGGVLVVNSEGEVVANPGGLAGNTLHAFTATADGRVIGLSSGATFVPFEPFVNFVEINADDGTISSLATLPDGDLLPGVEGIEAPVRLASDPAGDYYLIIESDNGFSLHRLDGTTLTLSAIPLPEGVELDSLSTVKVDPDGKLLVVALEKRLPGSAGGAFRFVYRVDPGTHDSEIAVGHGPGGRIDIGHMSPGNDQAIYYVPAPTSVGDQDHVLRMDLKTGGVTVVTSGEFEGALIDRGRQIAVNGQDIYVVNAPEILTTERTQLIHVDAATGAQTFLTDLGKSPGIQKMIFDEATGDLLMTTIGADPLSSFRTVMRVRPEANAVPEAVTQTPFSDNPRGLRVAENGDILVTGSGDIYRIDRATGAWTVLSESPLFQGLLDLAILGDGNIAVGDGPAQAVFLVDATTGEATEVITDIPVGEYLIQLPASGEPPLEPVVLSFTVEGDELVLSFPSAQGFTYQWQSSATPEAIAWAERGDPIAGNGSILEFRQDIGSTTAVELFRIRIDTSD